MNVGESRWDLLKNCAATIHAHLAQLQEGRHLAGAPGGRGQHPGALSPPAAVSAAAGPRLDQASELLLQALVPLVEFVGLGRETEGALSDLLCDIAPRTGEQGLLLGDFLTGHFRAMQLFAGQWNRPPVLATAEEAHALAFLEQALGPFQTLTRRVAEPASGPGQRPAGPALPGSARPAAGASVDPVLTATAASTARAADLIRGTLIGALRFCGLPGDWSDGVHQLLLAEPPADPLEALLRTQKIFCTLRTTSLAAPPGGGPGQLSGGQLVLRYQRLSGRLQLALDAWRRR